METKNNKNTTTTCPYAKKCGGCQYQGMDYAAQLKKKQKEMNKLLKDFGKPEQIIGMKDPLHYRNKVHAVFGRTRRGEIISGTYETGTHKIVNIDECMIEDEISKNNFVKALRKEHPEITTVVLNVNDKKTSMVLGERDIVLYGKGYIEDTLCGCTFRISPQSFYQINPVQTERLYQTAIDYAELTGKERVIDAYCGIGTIGMVASKKAREVIGVELNRNAVKDARINAKLNQIKNITFYEGDAGKFMVSMAEEGEKADVVFMDPPRSGSDEAFLSSVIKLAPKRIVYVSCGPDTLARDLKYLTGHGYKVKKIQPVDMFGFTQHTEIVCLLSNRTSMDKQKEQKLQ